ncbi:MAG: RNA polymerase sigma factor SigZ [Gammaproteobacteria bacterium]|nr:RNA polymerase sigma factor SigZ [Gammaproteobacteria bacterium]
MNIEKIWLEYKTALQRFLHSKVSNQADVDDLLQEILIKTYSNLSTVKDQTSIKSWLFQIANHTIIDFYRQKARDTALRVEDTWYTEQDNEVTNELTDCILPFIQALPAEHATLLHAIDIEKKSQKEYAQHLGISYSTLKSRVQKSRVLLKGIFDDCCHFNIDAKGNVFDYERKNKSRGQGCR